MADVDWVVEGPNNISEPEVSSWSVPNFTGFLCKPTYSIDKYNAQLSPDLNVLVKAEKIPGTGTTLPGFQNADLANSIMASLKSALFGSGGDDYIILPVPSMFMLLSGMNNNSRQAPFMDGNLLSGLATKAIQGIGIQIGAQSLLKDTTSDTSGSTIFFRQRLQVKQLTLGLLSTILGLLVVLTICILFMRPIDVVPSSTESVSFAAAILAASPRLRNLLRNYQTLHSDTELQLARFHTYVDATGSFKLEPKDIESSSTTTFVGSDKERWWKPTATNVWFILCMLILSLVLIAVLEVVQNVSDTNQGLAYVDDASAAYRYGVAYVPVLVMLGVSSMYNTYDFTTSVLAPFSRLRKSSAPASVSITASIVGKFQLHAFLMSFRSRHFAHCLTILAAFASSFLTIIAAGLYTPQSVPTTRVVQLAQVDLFNLTHFDTSQNDNFAGSTAALIVQRNLTYPQWTYKNLVFPTFSSPGSPLGANANASGTIITVKVPALRASLNCTAIPSNTINVTAFYWAGETSELSGGSSGLYDDPGSVKVEIQMLMEANFSSPLVGLNPKAAAKMGPAVWIPTLFMDNSTSQIAEKTFIGVGTPIQWNQLGNNASDAYNVLLGTSLSQVDLGDADALDVAPYYPGFALLFGTASANNTGRVGLQSFAADQKNVTYWDADLEVTAALCSQILEQVDTDVTMNWPEMTFSQSKPPVPDESTARAIRSTDTKGSAWFFETPGNASNPATDQDWFEISMNTFLFALLGSSTTSQTLDAWMTTLAYGKDGIPLSELAENQETLFNASSKLYGQYAAQAINLNMRNGKAPSGDVLSSYQATFQADGQRLVQNKVSKTVLQALLAFMVICGSIAFFLSRTRNILKHPPTSIAGKMILVANSELCNGRKVIPPGAEWWDKKTRLEKGVFDGWLFSLGWWKGEEGELDAGALPDTRDRWYGIDIGKAEKE